MSTLLRRFAVMLVFVAPMATGCGWFGDDDDEPRFEIVDAPIERVEIAIQKSKPPQYMVLITSGLPSGCAHPHGTELIGREGDTIRIRVTNEMQTGDIACTDIYGYFDSSINLGSDFTAGVTYTVDVNGTTEQFTAQ